MVVYTLQEITPQYARSALGNNFELDFPCCNQSSKDPHSLSLTAGSVIHHKAPVNPHSLETQVSVCPQRNTETVAFSEVQIITRKCK